jgi:hypothetical protein
LNSEGGGKTSVFFNKFLGLLSLFLMFS